SLHQITASDGELRPFFRQLGVEALGQQEHTGKKAAHLVVQLLSETLALRRLAVGQTPLKPLPLADVTDDYCESGMIINLADRQLHGGRWTIFVDADDFTPDSDDLRLAGLEVSGDVLLVLSPVRVCHERRNIPTDHVCGGITEDSFRRRIDGFDCSPSVNGD